MRKVSLYILFMVVTNPVFGACDLTTDMLRSGGDAGYDDYLYADTQQRELRNEGKQGRAYLCGAGYCPVGTKKRLQNAAVGNAGIENDAVYECINTGSSNRTSYRWVPYPVQETCVVKSVMESRPASDVDGGNDLYRVGNAYCKKVTNASNVTVDNRTNFWDTANTFLSESGQNFRSVTSSTINGGVELVVNFSGNVTERFRIMTNGTVKITKQIANAAADTIVGTLQTMTDGTVRIFDSAGKTFVGAMEIAKDGTVKVLDNTGRVLETLSNNATRSYIATLDFIETGIVEAGKTVRAISGDVRDVAVAGIDGGVQITNTLVNGGVETFRITKDGLVSVVDSSTQMVSATVESVAGGAVKISANMIDGAVRTFEIGTNGVVKVIQTGGDVIKQLSGDTVQNLKTLIGPLNTAITTAGGVIESVVKNGASVLKTGIVEAGKTVRAISGDVRDVAVAGIKGGTEIVVNFSGNVTERFRIMKDGTVQIIDTAGKTIVGTLQTMTDGTVRIFDSAGKTFLGALNIAKDGTIGVLNVGGDVIKTISNNMTDAYKSTLQFFGARMDSFEATVQTAIKSAADTVGIAIQTAGNIVTTAMNNATDFAKHFTTEIVNGVQALQINKHRLGNLEERIAQCTTQEQVAALINQALKDAELSDAQCSQVQSMISDYAKRVNQQFMVIENSIAGLAAELAVQKQQIMETANRIEQLGGQYTVLAAQVRTKVNAKQVIELIGQHTQTFSDGQVKQLYAILDEYTKKLSDGQRNEVAGLIAQYVDPKFERVDARIDLEAKRRVAMDKVTSAMSVLNAFASGADVSVWKNQDGKFNTARLASDATAGVVLGTVGGLVSNKIVKKNQLKRGFEDVNCSVGGQIVADWADEFTVGVQ